MKDWATGLTILSVAFVGTVVVTMGLAAVIVPRAFSALPADDPVASGDVAVDMTPPPVDQLPVAIGGAISVSGDREGTLRLDREQADVGFEFDEEAGTARLEDGPYRLSGNDGQITFEVDPLAVQQIDFDGLSFYPQPEDCEITAGVLNPQFGIASARLRCEGITDVRDNGVVTLDGTIMASGDLLGMRGDLPSSGGSLAVGSTTIELTEARLLLEPFGFDAETGLANLPLLTADQESGLIVEYDPHTHELDVGSIVVGGDTAEFADGDCSVTRTDIGRLNPRTSVVELSVACGAVELPELGSVPVTGSLVVDLTGIDAPP